MSARWTANIRCWLTWLRSPHGSWLFGLRSVFTSASVSTWPLALSIAYIICLGQRSDLYSISSFSSSSLTPWLFDSKKKKKNQEKKADRDANPQLPPSCVCDSLQLNLFLWTPFGGLHFSESSPAKGTQSSPEF